jgi:predicted GNAT family N-acyltransferase
MDVELITPGHDRQWRDYHAIRRTVLFESRLGSPAYDENHPDEVQDGNFPKLLVTARGEAIGVVRIDIRGPDAFLRRVAIAIGQQRMGYGRLMMGCAIEFCRRQEVQRLISEVAPDAVGFYSQLGFHSTPEQTSDESVRMAMDI